MRTWSWPNSPDNLLRWDMGCCYRRDCLKRIMATLIPRQFWEGRTIRELKRTIITEYIVQLGKCFSRCTVTLSTILRDLVLRSFCALLSLIRQVIISIRPTRLLALFNLNTWFYCIVVIVEIKINSFIKKTPDLWWTVLVEVAVGGGSAYLFFFVIKWIELSLSRLHFPKLFY